MDDLVERTVEVGSRRLDLLIPRDSEALIDEEAFEHEEFMPYWAELWPSGVALAEYVAGRAPAGSVLEIGCGLGLPSLVAALGGARVVASDWAPDAVALLERNAARAGAVVDVRRWSWTEAAIGRFDLVLAADVLYERRNGPQLLRALPALGGEVWLAEPGRPAAASFFEAAEADGWVADEIAPRVHRLRRAGAAP